MNNYKKFDETKLPHKKEFYILLRDEPISDKDYKHAVRGWDGFKIKMIIIHWLMCLKNLKIFE